MDPDLRIARQIGAALRRARMARGMYQYMAADLAGVSKGMLSAIETGSRFPNVQTLTKVLIALDCSAEEFGRYVGPWGSVR
jgi:transcriptional regulator with XRE-family HTH domain